MYDFTLVVRESICPSIIRPSVFSFPDDNLSKYRQTFIKIGICFGIVDIWSGIANGHISYLFERIMCPRHDSGGIFYYAPNFKSGECVCVCLCVCVWGGGGWGGGGRGYILVWPCPSVRLPVCALTLLGACETREWLMLGT